MPPKTIPYSTDFNLKELCSQKQENEDEAALSLPPRLVELFRSDTKDEELNRF